MEKAFEMIEVKVAEINQHNENVDDDEGPENPLHFEALEAVNAMDDFQRINLAEDKQSDENNIESMIAKLNVDQKRVFDMVTKTINNANDHGNILRFFVSGTGGTGKSFLVKTLKAWVQSFLNKKVAINAPTGIAAFNVHGLTIYTSTSSLAAACRAQANPSIQTTF